MTVSLDTIGPGEFPQSDDDCQRLADLVARLESLVGDVDIDIHAPIVDDED